MTVRLILEGPEDEIREKRDVLLKALQARLESLSSKAPRPRFRIQESRLQKSLAPHMVASDSSAARANVRSGAGVNLLVGSLPHEQESLVEVGLEQLEAYVEHRRAGRTAAEKQYAERRLGYDILTETQRLVHPYNLSDEYENAHAQVRAEAERNFGWHEEQRKRKHAMLPAAPGRPAGAPSSTAAEYRGTTKFV